MLTIDLETARRFILGKQGLWPGRRWRGAKGVEQAMRALEYLQLDPLQVIDEPDRGGAAIFDHYETRGFGPLPEEHELLLNL